MTEKVQLAMDDGLFELAGPEPMWIWAHTCPTPDCECRDALILATTDGREALLQRGAGVRAAWNSESSYKRVASQLTSVEAFILDLDAAEAFPPVGDEPLSLADHPRVRAVVERIDGEILDALGRLWYRGKGKPEPETRMRATKKIVLKGWCRGEMVGYDEVCGVRQDVYLLDGKAFDALELYCPKSGCKCGTVAVNFERCDSRTRSFVGRVVIERSGATQIEPSLSGAGFLDRLWTEFQKRHPRCGKRFARREAMLKELGSRFFPKAQATQAAMAATTVGRNNPCPCGSGKKYKKCCALAASQQTGLPGAGVLGVTP